MIVLCGHQGCFSLVNIDYIAVHVTGFAVRTKLAMGVARLKLM